jgi:hypothetical protein
MTEPKVFSPGQMDCCYPCACRRDLNTYRWSENPPESICTVEQGFIGVNEIMPEEACIHADEE